MSKRSIRKRRHLPQGGDERVVGVTAEIVTERGTVTVRGVDLATVVIGDRVAAAATVLRARHRAAVDDWQRHAAMHRGTT